MADAERLEPGSGSRGDIGGASSLGDGSQPSASQQETEGEDQGSKAERPSSSSVKSSEGDGDGVGGGNGEAEGEEEEVGECGFCLFMKSGPCRDSFINWEECVEQAEKAKEDIVEKCHKVTFILKECMEHNSDYYEPVLQAEKAMGEEAEAEAEAEAAAEAAHHDGEEVRSPPPPDSSEVPSLPATKDQHSPESVDSPLRAPQHPPSE